MLMLHKQSSVSVSDKNEYPTPLLFPVHPKFEQLEMVLCKSLQQLYMFGVWVALLHFSIKDAHSGH